MPSISFPRGWLIDNTQQNKQEKQDLLRKLLLDNLANKSREDVIKFCRNGLYAISIIVDSNGNLEQAKNNLNPKFQSILALFTNRNRNSVFNLGLGYQNINKNAAKYSEVLRQIFFTLSPSEKLHETVQSNINLISNEANKWYRANYIKNVSVESTSNGLVIKLGQENGDMGQIYRLDILFVTESWFFPPKLVYN